MSNLLAHADREFAILMDKVRAENPGDDSALVMQERMHSNLRDALAIIAEQGHSGFSIGVFTSMLTKLVDLKPLSAITGEDSEWVDMSGHSDGQKIWQNNRCGHVFKDEQGRAYDAQGICAIDENGMGWNGSYSKSYVSFPYFPTRSFITYPDDNSRFEKAGLASHKRNFKTAEEAHGAYDALLQFERNAGQENE